RYEIEERRGVGKRIAEEATDDAAAFQDVVGRDRRVHVAKRPIISGSEEREWRNQCAGADSRNDVELRAIACIGPSCQNARAERSVITAAGNGKKMRGRQLRARCKRQRLPLPLNGILAFFNELVALLKRKETGIRDAERQCLRGLRGGYGRQSLERGTARNDKNAQQDNPSRGCASHVQCAHDSHRRSLLDPLRAPLDKLPPRFGCAK